ncbi:4968_t:CDS:2 [Gigaspora margarita]|uniref:Histone-lysine N-methyltransferase, H3 lysine-4 specific n=1 Tax=Gigaspora margarita TaxID=4874 RepID=A0ABN7V3B7_GIGMA|nr:4968_t:CDS:2 [Gigaspora margarita]
MLFQESEEENMYITSKYEPPTDFDTITIHTTNVSTNFGTISPTTNVTTNISKYEPSTDYNTIDTITTPTANVSVDLDIVTTPITSTPANYGTITPMTEVPEFFLLPEVDIKTCRVLLKPYCPRSASSESNSSALQKDDHQSNEGPLIYYEPNLTPETLAETNAKVTKNIEHQLRQPKGDPRINREYALSLNVKRQKHCKSLQVLTYEQDKKAPNRKESTIIISFLDKFMLESQIRENFEECGFIQECNIEKHPDYNHNIGIATVTYYGDDDGAALNAAREAVIRFNGKQISGGPPIKVELDNDGSKLKSAIDTNISEDQAQKGSHSPSNSHKSTPLANDIDMEIDDIPSPSPPMAPPPAPPIKIPLDPPPRSLDSINNKFTHSISTKDSTLTTKLLVKDSSKISLKDSVPASKMLSKTFSTSKVSSKDFDSDIKGSSKDSAKLFSEALDKNEQKQDIQFMNDDKEDGEIDSNTEESTPRNIKVKGFERNQFDSTWRYPVESRTRLSSSWREYDHIPYDSDRYSLDRRRRNSSRDRPNKSKYSADRSRSRSRDRSPNGFQNWNRDREGNHSRYHDSYRSRDRDCASSREYESSRRHDRDIARSRGRENDQSRDKDNNRSNDRDRDYSYNRNTSERSQIIKIEEEEKIGISFSEAFHDLKDLPSFRKRSNLNTKDSKRKQEILAKDQKHLSTHDSKDINRDSVQKITSKKSITKKSSKSGDNESDGYGTQDTDDKSYGNIRRKNIKQSTKPGKRAERPKISDWDYSSSESSSLEDTKKSASNVINPSPFKDEKLNIVDNTDKNNDIELQSIHKKDQKLSSSSISEVSKKMHNKSSASNVSETVKKIKSSSYNFTNPTLKHRELKNRIFVATPSGSSTKIKSSRKQKNNLIQGPKSKSTLMPSSKTFSAPETSSSSKNQYVDDTTSDNAKQTSGSNSNSEGQTEDYDSFFNSEWVERPYLTPEDGITDAFDLDMIKLYLTLQQNNQLDSDGEPIDWVEKEEYTVRVGDYAPDPGPHKTGCARTEGYYKIPPEEKRKYVTYGIAGTPYANATAPAPSPRESRAKRRELHARMATASEDYLQFNPLKSRERELTIAKSSIHHYGLFTLEKIKCGEFVIEYTGELIRQAVADLRERKYKAEGIDGSYMFRVGDDTIIDATRMGNNARLINHSCEPNCNAKILNVKGHKKIAIYAKRNIQKNEEITYDYKFPTENFDKIPCHCGASKCRGFLN